MHLPCSRCGQEVSYEDKYKVRRMPDGSTMLLCSSCASLAEEAIPPNVSAATTHEEQD